MKKYLNQIYANRYFLLFIMLFAYVDSIYVRISSSGKLDLYTFTPEAFIFSLINVGILFPIILFFIKRWQKSDVFSTKELLKIFGSSIVSFILIMLAIGFIIALAYGGVERNYGGRRLPLVILKNFLDALIYGSFFLAYYYFQKTKQHQEQLTTYHQALSESRINQLKTQLNPHFLFNNLNVLDQLIEENKEKASNFLNEFAEIYRYVLRASDKEIVSIDDELIFAEQYFNLIQHKYGNVYQLNIENKNSVGHIVPLTLQLLIENAIKHNLGTAEQPICIKVLIADNIIVSNNINLKKNTKTISGRALNNLKEQYRLLTKQTIEIHQSAHVFSVTIPFIHPTNK
ncbi:sensor histidine kinase [Gelidibacter maritimus]|uniref:Histidine kinase n=1 Tax=Gelidibacter maritimus TaxID=2761487 RepID=A0A7W2R544_9FLAO|nr:histidine kinase [Gelidibacter maritimus]MBA6154556.1 histidine kinase [Gelidibacter maritimus]